MTVPTERPSRGAAVRKAITSRAAGWVVAAALAGAVIALSIVESTTPSAVAVQVPFRAVRSVVVGPGGPLGPLPRQAPVRVVGPPVQVSPGAARIAVGPGGGVVYVGPGMPPGAVRIGPARFGGQFTTAFGDVVAGTVGSVSSSGFTVTVGGGQTVTVGEQSSTVYRKAGNPASASAVTKGARVAVLGSRSGSKITAIAVAVLP
jgi:hypothetical protein